MRLPELETFEETRDADGMLLMLAMEQYTQECITIKNAECTITLPLLLTTSKM